MGDYGFRVSQAGYDVKSATDRQLILSSSFNTLKFYIVGSTSISIPANTGFNVQFSASYSHNLNFVPAVSIFPHDGTYATQINSKPTSYDATQSLSTKLVDNMKFDYDLTSTTLTMYAITYDAGSTGAGKYWGTGTPARTIYFKYYIFTQQME